MMEYEVKDLDSGNGEHDLTTLKRLLELPLKEKERLGIVYTPFEIDQQPSSWHETFATFEAVGPKLVQFLDRSDLSCNSADRLSVTLIGAGTSDYVGRSIEDVLRREWRCSVQTIPSTTLFTELDDLIVSAPENTKHLWISFSRSGDSYEGVEVFQRALEEYPQIDHVIITCNAAGRMGSELSKDRQNVFCVALADRVNDRGLAMTSSFTNMVVAGHCLAHVRDLKAYRHILDSLVSAGTNFLPAAADLAARIANDEFTRICFLGTGALKAVGDESALKTMELTAGHYSVMSESFLGLRHGPLSWLNRETIIVGFLSGHPEKQAIDAGLLEELDRKKAGGCAIVIGPESSEIDSISADYTLTLDLTSPVFDSYRAPVDVIFAQCLGLFASLRQGLKPDAPSADGKIQRVVSKINFA